MAFACACATKDLGAGSGRPRAEEPHRVRNLAKSADVNRAIKRRYEEGWSYREIAEHLCITESSVRQRLQYMRRRGQINQPPRESRRAGHGPAE